MKLTIITADNAVYKDGVSYSNLDLSLCGIPENIHALQWKDDKGWIEFKTDAEDIKPANEKITELPAWAIACVAKWDETKAAEEAAILAAQQAAILAAQQTTA
jgi:hypothetical protein